MIRSIDIWVEREKDSVVVEKMNISKKQPELNERRRNYALKIIISGYFAFFLELTFYFLLYIHYMYIYLLSARLFQVRTCVPCLQVATPLSKKGYTFRGITFVPLLPERPKFSAPFVRDYQFRASSWVKAKFNGTTQSHSCFWFKKRSLSSICRKMFTLLTDYVLSATVFLPKALLQIRDLRREKEVKVESMWKQKPLK